MATVRDLLTLKGASIFFISPFAPIRDALKLMDEKKVGALIVINNGEIAGIFSERDFARKSITIPGFSLTMPVHMLMTKPVFYVFPTHTVEDCMTVMTEKRIRHLPVIEEEVLIGVLSIGDVVRFLMMDKHANIKDLESYITKSGIEE